jgi:LytS/YehU family sensor histidine kinase
MEIVRAYADILTRRYRDRVTLAIDVPVELHGHMVPVFSLQPLVENAFRHGVERREHASALEIVGRVVDGVLTLRVTDRGLVTPGRPRHRTRSRLRDDRAAHGVGLRNTRERLEALFGANAGLSLEHADDTATATLWLPARALGDAARDVGVPSSADGSAPPALAGRG